MAAVAWYSTISWSAHPTITTLVVCQWRVRWLDYGQTIAKPLSPGRMMNERAHKSVFFKGGGLILAVVAVIGVAVAPSIWVVLGCLALIVCAGLLVLRGQRTDQPLAEELLRGDKRLPVIYLRSFGDEVSENRLRRFLAGAFGRAIPGLDSDWGPREQVKLAGYMACVGPCIAIGRPGEPLPELGAGRLYVSGDQWRKVVGQYFWKAAVVVVRAGHTDGLRWEIEQLVRNRSPKKILFILPRTKSDHAGFRGWANGILPRALPENMPGSRLLTFSSDWQPLPLKAGDTLFQTLWLFFNQNGILFPKNQFQAMQE